MVKAMAAGFVEEKQKERKKASDFKSVVYYQSSHQVSHVTEEGISE